MTEELWIFGYGSLIWRPAFPYLDRCPAWVEGWTRRFWQGSTDHRGVPGAPGRVVTLIPEQGADCWGVAYRVAAERRHVVLEALGVREQGGYELRSLGLHFPDGRGQARLGGSGLVYLATPENPNCLGPAPLSEIAAQLRLARGPSGANAEYVLQLAASLRNISADDPHVFALERLLRGES